MLYWFRKEGQIETFLDVSDVELCANTYLYALLPSIVIKSDECRHRLCFIPVYVYVRAY